MLSDVATAAPTIGDATPVAQSMVQKAYYYHRWHRGWYGPRVRFYGGPGWATGTVGAVVRAIFALIVGAGAVLASGGACGAKAADR